MEEGKIERIPVKIEVATPADLQGMSELRYESIKGRVESKELVLDEGKTIDDYLPEKLIGEFVPTVEHPTEDEYFLVAKKEGKLLGMGGMFWRPKEERFLFRRFYVQPELKGKKIGGQLFRAAEERARHSRHLPKGIYLRVDIDNAVSQHIYKGWGFRETERDDTDRSVRMDLDF